MSKRLAEITEIRPPNAATLEAAKKHGDKVVAYNPAMLRKFLKGAITLGELEGISKKAQYQMAESGYEFLKQGKLDNARTVFMGLLALDPYDAYFHACMGSVAQQSDQLEEADKFYTRSLEINPFFGATLANRGEVRLARGDVAGAVNDLVKALETDPEVRELWTQRARVLLVNIQRQIQEATGAIDQTALHAEAQAKLDDHLRKTPPPPEKGKLKAPIVAKPPPLVKPASAPAPAARRKPKAPPKTQGPKGNMKKV